MASLLRSIGFRADVQVVALDPNASPYFNGGRRSRGTRPRSASEAGRADFPSAAGFIPPLLGCAAFVPTSPEINHAISPASAIRSIDAKMTRATALQATEPPAGDAALAGDRARATRPGARSFRSDNRRNADFLSKRVGNYQYNPQWGVLLSQAWVR